MRISDWSSDVCSSDLDLTPAQKQVLHGAIVLVGTSALGLSDLRTIPLQTAYPGVEVHANVVDAILQAALGEKTFYRQPDWAPAASILLLLLTGLLLAWLLPGKNPLTMLRSEEHTSELQSLLRISYADF